jgi:16S rRNA (cytidine1402-2'-O)-methyltransferase
VKRAPLGELAEWATGDVRGEITIVISGATAASPEVSADDLVAEVAAREAAGQPRKEAIAEVAKAHDIPKRQVFDAVVAAKQR